MQYAYEYDCHKCEMKFETLESKACHLESYHGIKVQRFFMGDKLTYINYDHLE